MTPELKELLCTITNCIMLSAHTTEKNPHCRSCDTPDWGKHAETCEYLSLVRQINKLCSNRPESREYP